MPEKEEGNQSPLSPGRIGSRIAANVLTRILTVLVTLGILAVLIWGFRAKLGEFFRDTIGKAFSESQVITDAELESRLEAIGELAAYEYSYTGKREIKNTRQIFGLVSIPGTTHKIRMIYHGTIKVGCRVADIGIHYDRQDRDVVVSLPDPRVLDNYIDMETLQVSESNNILNPIDSDEITRDLEMVKAEELKLAEQAGIYSMAEENIKTMISSLLSDVGRDIVYETISSEAGREQETEAEESSHAAGE